MRLGPSRIAGLGVFALKRVEKGQFVMEYTGELIDEKVYKIRQVEYQNSGFTYVFGLRVQPKMFIDSTYCGNLSRFVNHSCEPNVVAHQVIHFGEVKVFYYALTNIKFGEEIFLDYGVVEASEPGLTCRCGSDSCRGYLPSA